MALTARLHARSTDLVVTSLLLAVLAAIAARNALDYPPIGGYDAAEHIAYAGELLEGRGLPEDGASYTPPGFYVVAAAAIDVGRALGLTDPLRAVQLVNAALAVGTAALVVALARLLFPGRPVVRWAALAFFVTSPLVLKTHAMFHPQPLALFLSTLALTLTAWMIGRRQYHPLAWIALAAVLAAAQLVRSVALATVAVVLVTLILTAIVDRESRRRLRNALLVVTALIVLLPLPWYIHLKTTTGSAIFGRASITSSVFETGWPAAFYVSPGLPSVISAPHRPDLPPRLLPTLYADTWGDYFGSWSWGPPRPELTPEVNRRLTIQSVVGLPLTTLAFAGWLALAGLAVGRRREDPARLVVVLLPAAALASVVFYSAQAPHPDGDTVKALFLLPAVPAWALSLGFALDVVIGRVRWAGAAAAVVLAACALVSLAYGTFAAVS